MPAERNDPNMADPAHQAGLARFAHPLPDDDAEVDRIVAAGPVGAFAVAGVATAIVVLIYLAFFVFAYLPRGALQ